MGRGRRGWGSVLLIAALGALVGGVCGTAAAAARRTVTADDRLTEAGGEPDALIFLDERSRDQAEDTRQIAALPSVAAAGQIAYTFVEAADDPSVTPWFTSVDGAVPADLAGGRLVAGRQVRPGATDEVVLAEPAARRLHLDLGDVLHLRSYTPAQTNAVVQGGEPVDPEGPDLDLRVVGITRSSQDVIAGPDDPVPATILSSAIHDAHLGQVAFFEGIVIVDLRPGLDVEDLTADVRRAFPGFHPPQVDSAGFQVISLDDTLGTLAGGLWVFAGVVAVFGLAVVAQAIARVVARRQPEQLTLAALGMTRRGRFLAAWRPVVVAAVLAGVGAVALAVIGSSRMPIGLAHRVEPDLGVDVDLLVLTAVAATTAVVVLAVGAWSAWRLVARPVLQVGRERPRSRPGLGHGLLARRPTTSIGLGMAGGAGRRPEAVAVRTAVAGIALGVVGIAAVAVLGASMSRLLDTPARYGWNWDAFVRPESGTTAEVLAARDDVAAVAITVQNQTVEVDGRSLNAMAFDPVRGEIGPTIISGRAPAAPDEVALAADTDASFGHPDAVEALDVFGNPQPFRVVGTVVVPSVQDPVPVAEGALFSWDGLELLGFAHPDQNTPGVTATVVRFAEGVDPREALGDLADDPESVRFPDAPPEIQRLDQVDALPQVLAVFLGGLALVAVGNALWQTVQHRRRELAVLRAIGFSRGQVTASVGWQALALGLAGVVVGVPVGLVLGRWVWEVLAGALGVAGDPLTPAGVAVVAGATLVLVAGAGLVFGAVAGRRSPTLALREG